MSTLGHLVECLLLTDAISKGVWLTPTGGKLGSALTDSYKTTATGGELAASKGKLHAG